MKTVLPLFFPDQAHPGDSPLILAVGDGVRTLVATQRAYPAPQTTAHEALALEALRTVCSDNPAEAEALAWGIRLLSGPLDDVVDFDPRWEGHLHRVLLAIGEREGFAVTRAAGLLAEKLGEDAQQSRGRVNLARLREGSER